MNSGLLPGFTWVQNVNSDGNPYATSGPARIMLHMTVSKALSPSYIAVHPYSPQLWANPYTKERWQTIPLTRAGLSLFQPPDTEAYTNRHGFTVQVELVGVPQVNQVTYTPEQEKWIGEEVLYPIMKWFADNGIPYDRSACVQVDNSSGSASEYWPGRFTDEQSQTTGGVVQHILEVGNDHWDCSVERTREMWKYALAKFGNTPTTPKKTNKLLEMGMFALANKIRGVWLLGPGYAKGLTPDEWSQISAIPGIVIYDTGDNTAAFDLFYSACMFGITAQEVPGSTPPANLP